jgi:hypothetical protein
VGAALSVTELDTIGADCGDRLQHTVFADVGDELHVEGVLFPTFVPIVRLAGIRSIGARATEPALAYRCAVYGLWAPSMATLGKRRSRGCPAYGPYRDLVGKHPTNSGHSVGDQFSGHRRSSSTGN